MGVPLNRTFYFLVVFVSVVLYRGYLTSSIWDPFSFITVTQILYSVVAEEIQFTGVVLVHFFTVRWVRVSNAFYASLRLLKAGNSGGLPSLSLLVFRHVMSVNHPFRHFRGPFLQFTAGHAKKRKWRGGGQAHQICRPSSLAGSGRIACSFSRIPVFRYLSSFYLYPGHLPTV